MNVTEFQIEAYRGKSPLRFVDLGAGLNLALVRSHEEARELLQVIPATLYGRGQFYSEAPRDVMAGCRRSQLTLRTDQGVFRAERFWDRPDLPLRVTSNAQKVLDESAWQRVLHRVPPRQYARCFTFDLRRLRRLVRDPQRAMTCLSAMARALRGKNGQMRAWASLAPLRSTPRTDWKTLGTRLRELRQLLLDVSTNLGAGSATQSGAQGDPESLVAQAKLNEQSLLDAQQQLEAWERELHTRITYAAQEPLHKLWQEVQAELNSQEMDAPRELVDSTHASLERIQDRVARVQEERQQLATELKEIRAQREQLRTQYRSPQVICKIELLLSQEKSLQREEDQLEQLKRKIEDLHVRAELDRSELVTSTSRPMFDLPSPSQLARMESLAEQLKEAERERDAAEQRVSRLEAQASTVSVVSSRPRPPVNAVKIHETQQRVAALREQLGWREGHADLVRQRDALQRQVESLYAEQIMPMGTTLTFGIPFVAGVGMILYALVYRAASLNWTLIFFGALLAVITAVLKMIWDRDRGELLSSARQRLARVSQLLEQGEEASPTEHASLVAQLQAAERELSELEQLHASESQASTSRGTDAVPMGALESARLAAQQAQHRWREVEQRWREWLLDAGLPHSLNPHQARELLAERTARASTREVPLAANQEWQLQPLRQELDRRQEWLSQQLASFRQVAKELGHATAGNAVAEYSDLFRETLREHREREQVERHLQRTEDRLRQRDQVLRENIRQLHAQRASLRKEIRQKQLRKQLESRQRQARKEWLQRLVSRLRPWVENELSASREGRPSHDTGMTVQEMEVRIQGLREEIASLRERLHRQYEQRGRLQGLMGYAPANPSGADRNLLDAPLAKLDSIEMELRAAEERDHQANRPAAALSAVFEPYTVKASRLLRRLSGGQYAALRQSRDGQLQLARRRGEWVPAEEIAPEHLANVYFALWLTRLEMLADRGTRLPVVMQDPLMVTPRKRQTTVTKILREFAARGHQILVVCTCKARAQVYARLGVPIADVIDRESDDGEPNELDSGRFDAPATAWGPKSNVFRDANDPLNSPIVR